MSYPKDFVATEFFTPTEEQKADYYITGQEVEYYFTAKEYGEFKIDDIDWHRLVAVGPPTVYCVFEDDNCWVSNFKTTTSKEFTNHGVAIRKDSTIFSDLIKEASKHLVTVI